jgi:uncharacterized membrane protein
MLDFLSPMHPKIVHFPIALFMTALGLDLVSLIFKKDSLHKTALHIYVIAALMTPWVVRTGLWEEERLHLRHPLLDQHRQFALWTMWTSLMSLAVLWFVQKKFPKPSRSLFLILLIAVAVFVTLTGHNGGRMVYEYGVGVER